MNDMSSVIVPKSDQINADDLIGGEMLITIREVKITGGTEQPVSIMFDGSDKAFRPCKSMSRVLVAAWGPDAKAYVGRSLQLYRDPTVKWGGMEVGGIRIRAMTDIERAMTMALTATKGSRKPYTVKPLANVPATKPDKAADGTREVIANLQACGPGKKAETILASAEVVKQREYLASKRPELAAELDAAVAALEAADESPFEPRPSTAPSPAEDADNQGAEHGGGSQEGRDDADMGEFEPDRAVADRLIADARAGAGRSAGEQAEYESLPDELRAEVDAASKGGE